MKLNWNQKFKHFFDHLCIFDGCFSLHISVVFRNFFFLLLITYKFVATSSTQNLGITGSATHKVRQKLYKIFRENNLIGSAWVSVNPLASQLWLQMVAMKSNMTAKGIFPWICAQQCPLKDEVYQLVIGTIPQRKQCPLQWNYVTEWLCLLHTNSIIEAGVLYYIPI